MKIIEHLLIMAFYIWLGWVAGETAGLIKSCRKFIDKKRYDLENKKVCDVCFQELKKLVEHIKTGD